VSGMIISLERMWHKIIKLCFNYIFKDMKSERHGPLESISDMFKAKGHFLICKDTPGTYKCGLVLVLGSDMDLIIPWETVHKRKNIATCTLINNFINERGRKVIFQACLAQIIKFHAYSNCAFLFVDGHKIRHPFRQLDWVDETILE